MTTDTATEAAAAAQRAAQKIDLRYCAHSCIDDTGWPDTTEIAAIIAAEIAPLQQRAEAGDKFIKLLKTIPLPPNAITYEAGWKIIDEVQALAVEYAHSRALVTTPEAEAK